MLSLVQKEKFAKDGYLVIPGFLTEDETIALQDECRRIVDAMDPAEHRTVFSNSSEKSHISDDYFLTSGDKIRFFFEEAALDDEGNLKCNKHESLNKIGHALHWLSPQFKKVTFSDKVKDVARSLRMIEPVVIHSMYIFKPPNIGAEVVPHQDATYLYCEPASKVVGLWITLEEATVDNGCLWFIPGSQEEAVERRMIRSQESGCTKMIYTAPNTQYDDARFVPEPVHKGDLILIHGKVIHKSAANKSDKGRPIYTFHLMDKHCSKFSELNWIQPTEKLPFTPLYGSA